MVAFAHKTCGPHYIELIQKLRGAGRQESRSSISNGFCLRQVSKEETWSGVLEKWPGFNHCVNPTTPPRAANLNILFGDAKI